jgi:hypothetical protein
MEPFELDLADLGEGLDPPPLVRPAWWRWVAIAVILAMVVAGPLSVALVKLLT